MGDYGIKVTNPGYDISSTEPRDYIINSAYGTVKNALTGSGTVTVPASSSVTVTIAHGLSFIPLCLFYTELSSGSGKYFLGAVRLTTPDADAGNIYVNNSLDGDGNPINTYVDATNLVISYRNVAGSDEDIDYFYVIFGDSGS